MIEEVDDNALILMSEESNSPLFVMDNSNSSSSNAYSHILAIDSTFFKKASNSDKMLVIEYTNGQVEYYQRHELLKDVYCPITGKRSRFSFTFKRSANR
jgi:hypothetical protein